MIFSNSLAVAMPLETQVIGSYSKPEYLDLPDWFREGQANYVPSRYHEYQNRTSQSGQYFIFFFLIINTQYIHCPMWSFDVKILCLTRKKIDFPEF